MQRKAIAQIRENLITLICEVLRGLFDLGERARKAAIPKSLLELPNGARVAIIKPCCLGDVVLATPVVRLLNETHPDLKLEFVVSDWAKPVLESNPRLSALIPTGFTGSSFSPHQYLNLVIRLRRQKYQAALVLDRSPLLACLPWLAGIPLRAGLDSRGRGFALNHRSRLEATDPIRHEAEIYLSVAKLLIVNSPKSQPFLTQSSVRSPQSLAEFYPGEQARRSFEEKALELGLDLGQFIAVIHPGGGQNPDTTVLSKRWPAANFAAIAQKLGASGVQVVVIGAKSDRDLAEEVSSFKFQVSSFKENSEVRSRKSEAFPDNSAPSNNQQLTTNNSVSSHNRQPIFNACEKFDIAESGALFERAGLFLGNDTGLMHLAAASGTPVVAIFGPSSPVAYGPFTTKGKTVSPLNQTAPAGLPLAEYQMLSAEAGGIAAISVAQVWEALQEFLPKNP